MSFRKRNVVVSTSAASQAAAAPKAENAPIPGVRPSPHDSRPTTSTGTASLDNLLAGHAGLPLGTSLLIGEHGTTDFAGVLLRYYAAEGLVQGHQVHVLGLYEGWKAELPGLSTDAKSSSKSEAPAGEKMKIAWRYETMGAPRTRDVPQRQDPDGTASASTFCHSFDLTKRLAPGDIKGQVSFHPSMSSPSPTAPPKDTASPFKTFTRDLASKLANSQPATIHRVIVPGILSPTGYAGSSSRPEDVLQFLHTLRALLRQHPAQLTALITLPLTLFPRSTGLTRWMEILSDGVLELVPLQSNSVHAPPASSSKSDSKFSSEEQVQGLLKVHTLPVFDEKGGGSSEAHAAREDQAFSLSRSRGLVIKPFSLPPVLDDEPERKSAEAGKTSMEF
ncbi:hypothetical protein DL766_010038 [Monosporascus sp. MC13-8B]|nr:hypothetical protein DL763_009800 [Monosporascus cannonballus]RYP11512.1 hypothetical protein DL766_010038 [Monosporascus sp. MC13-8B]